MKIVVHQMEETNLSALRQTIHRLLPLSLSLILMAGPVASRQATRGEGRQEASADWRAVEQAMGRSGSMQPGEVFKFSMPRSDLRVTVKGVLVKPALALGSWAAFKKMGDHAMVMGDLVLSESEVAPVMLNLQQHGIEQTALYHHVLGESPRVMYMHIGGQGDPVKMASAIRSALALTSTPALVSPAPTSSKPLGSRQVKVENVIACLPCFSDSDAATRPR